MKKIVAQTALILSLLLLFGGEVWAQVKKNNTIVGTVVDSRTKEAIPYAQVLLKGTTVGTTADAEGAYRIENIPNGHYTLIAQLLGYAAAEEKVSVEAGAVRHVDIYLHEQALNLDGVVVSANRQETRRKMASNLVTVLGGEVFTKTNSETLSQGLRFQPGLRIEDNCQNCGFNQVRINGLEGAYSQILIDSRPVFSALAGVYGLEQIPASMIERVEVVRGGGSALFGSNAIGGVINIITREPLRNTATLTHSLTSYGKDNHNFGKVQQTTSFNGALVTDDRRAGVMLFGQHSQRAGHDYNGDGFTELPELKSRSLGFRAYYKTSLYGKLTGEFRSMYEHRRGGDRLDLPPFQARIAEYLQHYIHGGSLRFDQGSASGRHDFSLYASAQKVLRKSYYGGGDYVDKMLKELLDDPTNKEAYDGLFGALTSYGTSKGLDAQGGGMYVYHSPAKIDWTAGAEYTYSSINDQSGFRPKDIDQVVGTVSGFTQLEYKTERWTALIGGRLDYVRLTQNGVRSIDPLLIFSPRANLRYNPNKDLSLRLSYSSGFRAPQFFDEEMHVELAGGTPVARVLAKNLREERSHSISASVDWYKSFGSWELNLMGEGFGTFLKHQFVASPIEKEINGIAQREIINSNEGTTKVFGVNIEGKVAFRRIWEMQAGITLQRSLYAVPKVIVDEDAKTGQKEVSTRQYERTPNAYAYMTSTYNFNDRLSLNLSATYTGRMLVPHEAYEDAPSSLQVDANGHFDGVVDGQAYRGVAKGHAYMAKSRRFFDLDAKLNYRLPLSSTTTLNLSAGVQNIFNAYQNDADKGPGRASTYVYGPMAPRRLFVSASFSI